MTPEYGITLQGFKAKRLIDIKNDLENLFIAEFSEINLDPQSVTGQLIGIYSKVLADIWENLEDVYFSQYPNSASGVSLDNVVQINGLTRLPAQQTSVVGVATGTENTIIPTGSLARIPQTQEIFYSTVTATISRNNAVQSIVSVDALAAQEYRVVINAVPYIYSLPIIGFGGNFVSGNVINVTLNGINLAPVNFTGTSSNTMDLLAARIESDTNVASATVVGATTIEIVPVMGSSVTINSVDITGGVSQPSRIIYFKTPADLATVAQYLAARINTASNLTASYVSGNRFTITSSDFETPYSINLGTNLSLFELSIPIKFLSQNYGPIAAPAGSLTEILTPVVGWTRLTNLKAGATGRYIETDSELRLRRLNSLRLLGAATVESIRSRILQEVPGVSSVTIFENITLTQLPTITTFNADFVTGNVITTSFNGNDFVTNFTTDHLTTINLIKQQLQTQRGVESVVISGMTNRILTVNMLPTYQANLSFDVTGGASQTTYTQTGGRPPKSYEVVVDGGSDADLGLKIWQTKPAGIQTYGNQQVNIIDSQGTTQAVFFSRAVPVYISVLVNLTLNPQETFPANGQELIRQAIYNYGNSLGIGVDVFIQRVLSQVFTVPGVASATVQLARTANPSDTPSYSTSNIDIADIEVSEWDINRIIVSV